MPLREQAHLVEEERAAVSGLEEPDLRLAGLAVRAAREAEELRLAERLRQAPQLTEMNGAAARGLALWSTLASNPLPLPVSPWMRTNGRRRPRWRQTAAAGRGP